MRSALAGLLAGIVAVSLAAPVEAARGDDFPTIHVRIIDAFSLLPVVDASVAVSFEGGDPDHPIVTGQLWNGTDNGGGNVIFRGLAPGLYVVSVSASSYMPFGHGAIGDRLPSGDTVVVPNHNMRPAHIVVHLVPLPPKT